MCLNFHNQAHRRAQAEEQETTRTKSSTSTSPLQLQIWLQQQQTVVYDPLHDCYSAWLYRLKLHCSDLIMQDPETENSNIMIDVPSRIARLDGLTEADDFMAELDNLSQELAASSQDSHANYAAGICFDACIPRLLYFTKQRQQLQQLQQKHWEEMPDVSLEHSVCEASLSDLFPIIHEAFLRPHGVHSDNIYVHFFYKIMPQRSVVRNYESMVKEHFFENSESRWLVDRLLLCTLLGAYRHADPLSRPGDDNVRIQLNQMLNRPRRFYTQRYTRGNTYDDLWQADLSSTCTSLTPDVIDAFISGLLQHCREVVMFAMREFLVYCIDDDPSMKQVAQSMFNYERFRSVVIGTTNKIRAYIGKNLVEQSSHATESKTSATMTLDQLIVHRRHVHPHVSEEQDSIKPKTEQDAKPAQQADQPPAAKRQKRSRRGTAATRRGKLRSGQVAMTCYEWDLATIVKAPTTQLRTLSFQKPIDPITKAFDTVQNQICRQVPWEKYGILPVRMYLNEKELLQLRDELQISYPSHELPDDLKVDGKTATTASFSDGDNGLEEKTKQQQRRKPGAAAAADGKDCQMNWEHWDKQRLSSEHIFIQPLHPFTDIQSKCIWQSASEWQTALDVQMGSPVTQVYVTDQQITARHSFMLYRWLTQCTEATTPTIDLWNMFLRILPAFNVSPEASARLQRMTEKYYPYRYTKESWVTTVNHFADHHLYAYVLVQAFVSMLKSISSTAVHKLPLNYREQQMSALNELAVRQMHCFEQLAPDLSGALCVPEETVDLWFCSVCNTIYSLLDDPNSPYKHQYRLGLREAVFDFETGEAYCYRNASNMHMHCQAQPLCRLPVLERLVQFKKMHLMLCPSCGVMMVLNTEQCCLIAGKGYVCSACTKQWRGAVLMNTSGQHEPSEQRTGGSHQTLLQQATECYLCNVKTTILWYYGPNTFLCRRHHKASLARFLVQQATTDVAQETKWDGLNGTELPAETRDLLRDMDWVRKKIHKFKTDYMERTAPARKKYNDAMKRRVKKYRVLNERR